MEAKERFRRAAAAVAHEQLVATGWDHYFFDDFAQVQQEAGASDNESRIVVTAMEDEHLVSRSEGRHFRATPFLALLHENYAPEAAYDQNQVRRAVLREAWRVQAEGSPWVRFDSSDVEELGYPVERLRAAARVLDAAGYVELKSEFTGSFICGMRSKGNELMADEALLRATLPLTLGEDDDVMPTVAPDVLKELILSCEQLLETKGWKNALDELRRGDDQYAKGDWVNAVREHYSSLESGFKYALHVEGQEADTNALKSLAKLAAERGLIPPNYQALFGFPNSIRSPRSQVWFGPPEQAKTWVALADVADLLRRGLSVVWVDMESGHTELRERLSDSLGIPDELLTSERFVYLEMPAVEVKEAVRKQWFEMLEKMRPALIVVDAQQGVRVGNA